MYQQLQKICRQKVVAKRLLSDFREIWVKYPMHPQKIARFYICVKATAVKLHRSLTMLAKRYLNVVPAKFFRMDTHSSYGAYFNCVCMAQQPSQPL